MEERPHCNSISTLAVNVENLWSAMDRLKLKVMARKDENNKLHADNAALTTRVEALENKLKEENLCSKCKQKVWNCVCSNQWTDPSKTGDPK